jgi:diacylglycerol O-acyltransferase / wax synthase
MGVVIRAFLLDDHEIVRRGLRDVLEANDDIEIVGEAGSAEEAYGRIPATRPDVAVLDVQLPDGNGVEVCREIRSAPRCRSDDDGPVVTIGRQPVHALGSPSARGAGVRQLPVLGWGGRADDGGAARRHPAGPVERTTADDVMQLASDVGLAPMQVGAVLVLAGDPDTEAATSAIRLRTAGFRRLRQRLVRVPFGCGRPIWIDDTHFDIARHVRVVRCPQPADEAALLRVASGCLTRRLAADRPLWSATLVTGLAAGETALVFVFHHVLADGLGGLAMLAQLVDGMPMGAGAPDFPRRPPSRAALIGDACASHRTALSRLPGGLRRLGPAIHELGAGRKARAPRSSLNQPPSGGRELATAAVALEPIRVLAHRHGATVNDVVLTAVTAVLAGIAAAGGEPVDDLVVSVPVAGRTGTTAGELGNRVGVMTVSLPTHCRPTDRLRRIAAITSAQKARRRGASALLVVPVFRALGAVGLVAWLVDHQRLVNTFVTNLRGPDAPMTFLGTPIRRVVALSGTAGNVTVVFAVLSYAGTLSVTVTCDPGCGTTASAIAERIEQGLNAMRSARGPS